MEYIGHPLQIRGVEKVVLQEGKGDGMHFLIVRNGIGLEVWISLDRAADLTRVIYNGKNMGYMSACGNVHPSYYDSKNAGFLKSFTAGFMTTTGLTAVGTPCIDDGEELPLHGTISNIPAILNGIEENDDGITIKATIRDTEIFSRKLILTRTYFISYKDDVMSIRDNVKNEDDKTCPYEVLYHCNMGYPLLSENSIVTIPNDGIKPRNDHAKENIDNALVMEKPQANYEESCFYYDVKNKNDIAKVGIFNKDINAGIIFSYNKKELPCFTEWKMMGRYDYVLGLEPGNCTPDGRDVLRKNGTLKFIEPNKSVDSGITWKFESDINKYEGEF